MQGFPKDRQGHSRSHVEEGCEREPNKRKDGTFHDDVYDAPPHTNKHSTSWRFDLVSPWRLDHPSGSRQGRYDARPWVAQPHEHAHAAQVTDTRVANTGGAKGVKVRGTEAWWRSRVTNYRVHAYINSPHLQDSNNDHSASFDRR